MVVFFLSMGAGQSARRKTGSEGQRSNGGIRGVECRKEVEGFRHGIFAACVEWVAPQEPPHAEIEPGEQAMGAQCLHGVMRTGRVKTTTARRSEQQRQQRRNEDLVGPHRTDRRPTGQPPHPGDDQRPPARNAGGRRLTWTVRRQVCG